MIPKNIQLTLRIPKGSPLTPEEVDANFVVLRDAITALAEEFNTARLIIGEEPPVGERPGTLWIPADFRSIYVWNSGNSTWFNLTPKEVLHVTDTGSGVNYIIQMPEGITTYADLEGRVIVMRSVHASTGASKLLVKNSEGTLFDNTGLNLVNHYLGTLEPNDIKVGQKVMVVLNSGQFQLLTPTPPIRLSDYRNVFTYRSNLAAVPVSGGKLTFTHGLKYNGNDIMPALVQVFLRRKTSSGAHESGIVIDPGKEIDGSCLWTASRGSENEMFWPVVRTLKNATTIEVGFYYPNGIAMLWGHLGKNGQASGAGSIGDPSLYDVIVYAIAFNPDQFGSNLDQIQSGGGSQVPVVTAHPANVTANQNQSMTFSVTANYGTSVTWFYDGQEVGGSRFSETESAGSTSISSVLTISGTSMSDSGRQVYARVNGPGGTVTSNPATITVNP
jgi:hypothetical protein